MDEQGGIIWQGKGYSCKAANVFFRGGECLDKRKYHPRALSLLIPPSDYCGKGTSNSVYASSMSLPINGS